MEILSAGAARGVVGEVAKAILAAGGGPLGASFGGVQAIRARVESGEPADVVILTREMIDELGERGWVARGSAFDLGAAATAIAVRGDAPRPALHDAASLARALRAARCIVCPDPRLATAGEVLFAALERLGLRGEVESRLALESSGHAVAQRILEEAQGSLGVMQVPEIVVHPGLALAGVLPGGLGRDTVYTACVTARSTHPERAAHFIASVCGATHLLQAAGFVPRAR